MTTQPEKAVGGDVPMAQEPADARDAFENIAAEWLGEDEEPAEAVEEEAPEAETDEEAEDEPEIEAEEEELPPIDPPVSWDAEAKEAFAKLPRDLQETVQKREAERERFVQQKSQETARTQRETQQAAIQQLAEIERGYADQYQAIARQFDVPEPDMSLLATNPAEYAMQAQRYQRANAQRQEMQRAAEQYAEQARAREAQAEQAYHAEQTQILSQAFPEYLDPTTGPELQRRLSAVAKRIGYSDELIAQARANDILAMRTVADAFDKADKYDKLQAKKMEKVRAAKGLPKVATPGVAVGAQQQRQARAQSAWERTKGARNATERADAFAEYLQSTGQI